MPLTVVNNVVPGMTTFAGQLVNQFGLDTSGTVNYQFNHQGFRSNKDFDFIPDYAFFGCSLVFGIGIPIDKVFSSFFTNSQNYGVAGIYENTDIFKIVKNFLSSDLYSQKTKIVIVWTERNDTDLETYYHLLSKYCIHHFYCGKKLSYNNCYAMPPKIDVDVSGTHMGEKTHSFFWKILCQILKNQ
jgi:hypothetical protein